MALRTLHSAFEISKVDHATRIVKISFLKFPTTFILNSNHFSLVFVSLRSLFMQPVTAPWKTKWAHFHLRGTFQHWVGLLWKSFCMLMKSVIYFTFMPIGEIKKYQITCTCIPTCTWSNNTTGLEKCHPGQVDFPAGQIIFHSFLPEGERGWTSYLPTKN